MIHSQVKVESSQLVAVQGRISAAVQAKYGVSDEEVSLYIYLDR